MKKRFRWNRWNVDHIARHGVTPVEAEYVVEHAGPPYPRAMEDEKWIVRGQTREGRYIQVIYLIDADKDFDYAEMSPSDILEMGEENTPRFYVIHSRELTDREKFNYRRRR